VKVNFVVRSMTLDAMRAECVAALVARKDDFFLIVAWHFAKGPLGLCRIVDNLFGLRWLRATRVGFIVGQVFQLRFDVLQLGVDLLSILLS